MLGAATILESQSQGKLDLTRLPFHLRELAATGSRRFRKRGQVPIRTVEYLGSRRFKVGMVQDIEEFSPELQRPGFSQEPQLCVASPPKSPNS